MAEHLERTCALLPGPLPLEAYDRAHSPRPEVAYAAMLTIVYLRDDEGEQYRVERVFDEGERDTTSVTAVRFGPPDLAGARPVLWPDGPRGKVAVAFEQDAGAVRWRNDDVTFTIGTGPVTWRDGGGAMALTLDRLADRGYSIWLPEQHGLPCQYHRAEMFRAEGVLDGRPVSGWGYVDYAYGAPGRSFVELPMVMHLNKLWATWLGTFPDGSSTVGVLRWGRSQWDWSMAYVVRDGVAAVHDPVSVSISYGDDGVVRGGELLAGPERVSFEQRWRLRLPFTTLGSVAGSTSGTCELEWMPDNAPALFAAVQSGALTREHVASLRIDGERVVVLGLLD
ncbi:MAG TPA: hypothetical protein VM938_10895 [Acidimicrobiales bacterium]|nr:hypothetical protein [Acidimicrobiales bacterium]